MSKRVKVHYKIETGNRRRLAVHGRDVAFWEPSAPDPPSPTGCYGIDPADVGPANSTAETSGTLATTSNITSVLSAASPGDTILLRTGTYTGGETVPAGTAGNPITVKPYNKETVTITGNWTFNNYQTFDGLYWDSSGRGWTISINRNSSSSRHDLKWLYCDVRGGGTEGIRFAGNVTDVEIGYCKLWGGGNHTLKTHYKIGGSSTSWAPNDIHIHHCDITHLGTPGRQRGDLVQFEGWGGNMILEHNYFHDEPLENAVDIKKPYSGGGGVFLIRWNLFDHDTISNAAFIDHSGGITNNNSDTRWEDNYFPGSSSGAVATFGGDSEQNGYSKFVRNLIPDAPGRIVWWNQTNAVFSNNYIGPASMEMDNSGGSRPVTGLVMDENRFDGTDLNARTANYSGVNNEKNSVTGGTDWNPIGSGTADYPSLDANPC